MLLRLDLFFFQFFFLFADFLCCVPMKLVILYHHRYLPRNTCKTNVQHDFRNDTLLNETKLCHSSICFLFYLGVVKAIICHRVNFIRQCNIVRMLPFFFIYYMLIYFVFINFFVIFRLAIFVQWKIIQVCYASTISFFPFERWCFKWLAENYFEIQTHCSETHR